MTHKAKMKTRHKAVISTLNLNEPSHLTCCGWRLQTSSRKPEERVTLIPHTSWSYILTIRWTDSGGEQTRRKVKLWSPSPASKGKLLAKPSVAACSPHRWEISPQHGCWRRFIFFTLWIAAGTVSVASFSSLCSHVHSLLEFFTQVDLINLQTHRVSCRATRGGQSRSTSKRKKSTVQKIDYQMNTCRNFFFYSRKGKRRKPSSVLSSGGILYNQHKEDLFLFFCIYLHITKI